VRSSSRPLPHSARVVGELALGPKRSGWMRTATATMQNAPAHQVSLLGRPRVRAADPYRDDRVGDRHGEVGRTQWNSAAGRGSLA
jgi:hypothetical protein